MDYSKISSNFVAVNPRRGMSAHERRGVCGHNKKTFMKVNDFDILDNIKKGKIGLYYDELIPNIEIN